MPSPQPLPGRCGRKLSSKPGYCTKWPIRGGTVCPTHGGNAPHVKAAAKQRLEDEAARRAVTTLGLPRDIDPHAALLEEVHRTAGHVAWLGHLVADLDPHELKQYDTGKDGTHWEKPAVWVEMYGHERDRLVRVCKAAVDAGVAERQVRLAEQQGVLIAQVIRGVLRDLGVEGRPEVPAVVRRHLELVRSEAA